jgi:hypothetical protein
MNKYYCNRCHTYFSREWNLKRHKTDVHQEVENAKDYNVKQEFKENRYPMPFNNNSFNEQMANSTYNRPQQNSYSYNNNSPAYPLHNEYNNIQSFPNPHIKSNISETRTFSLDDKIRIQKKLKYLENILIKNLPKFIVIKRIKILKDQCYYEQSDEPLKRYIVEKNLGYLWPD